MSLMGSLAGATHTYARIRIQVSFSLQFYYCCFVIITLFFCFFVTSLISAGEACNLDFTALSLNPHPSSLSSLQPLDTQILPRKCFHRLGNRIAQITFNRLFSHNCFPSCQHILLQKVASKGKKYNKVEVY